MTRMVKARIRRMGGQWASCGVPVSPPDHLHGNPSAKHLCPKLVPGQVIEVPDDHNLLNQACVEIVRGLEKDEFLRPWVFPSAEAALLADPSKSHLGADQIASGLALAEGAQRKGRQLAEERQALIEANDERPLRLATAADFAETAARHPRASGPVDVYGDDDYVPTTQNRVSRVDADEMRGDEDETPVQHATVRRSRSPRGGRS